MSRMSISMCEKEGVPSVITMCSAWAASGTLSDSVEATRRPHALEQLLGAGLLERHRAALDSQQPLGVVVDPEHAQAAVGEAQRQRQADPSEADDRDVYGHVGRRG